MCYVGLHVLRRLATYRGSSNGRPSIGQDRHNGSLGRPTQMMQFHNCHKIRSVSEVPFFGSFPCLDCDSSNEKWDLISYYIRASIHFAVLCSHRTQKRTNAVVDRWTNGRSVQQINKNMIKCVAELESTYTTLSHMALSRWLDPTETGDRGEPCFLLPSSAIIHAAAVAAPAKENKPCFKMHGVFCERGPLGHKCYSLLTKTAYVNLYALG
jgi:hypothetical protein